MRLPTVDIAVAPPPYIPIGALIASGDFDYQTLMGTINSVPFEPSYLGDKGIFNYEGSMTRIVKFEFDGQEINLVPSAPPGSPGQNVTRTNRKTRLFEAPHLPQKVTITPPEVKAIRALGSEQLESVETHADVKIRNAVRNLRSTFEWHRMGAACGRLLDADSSVLYNFFDEFGIAEPTYDMAWATAGVDMIKKCNDLLNKLEDALEGNLPPNMPLAICGRTFWEKFITDPYVQKAYTYYEQNVKPLQQDLRYAEFEFGGILWRQYRGKVQGTAFMADAEARLIVDGVPGTYHGIFTPPEDIVSKVNETGEPFYATVKVLDHEGGFEIRIQSNPIHIMGRPAACIKLYSSN